MNILLKKVQSFLVHPILKALLHYMSKFTHIHTPMGCLGFCVLHKETLTCGPLEPWIKPPIFHIVDGPLYLLSHSQVVWCIESSVQLFSYRTINIYKLCPWLKENDTYHGYLDYNIDLFSLQGSSLCKTQI